MASITKRGDVWRAQIRRKGHPSISDSFPTKQEAQRWAREKEHEIDKGKNTPAGLRLTIDELIQKYRDEMGEAGYNKKRTLKFLQKRFEGVRLEEFGQQSVMNFASKRELEGVSPVTLLNDLSYLRVGIRYGGMLCEAGEAAAIAVAKLDLARDFLWHAGRIAVAKQRDRRPTLKELQAIEAFAKRRGNRAVIPFWEIVLFALTTAMRLGEICGPGGLRWSDVNWEERTVLVRERKHPDGTKGNDEIVPLPAGPVTWNGAVVNPVEILKRSGNRQSERIFPNCEGAVSDLFRDACRESNIHNLRFHDLRHEAVSRMFEHGMQIPEVAMVSGHKDWKNLKRYTNLKPSFVHEKLVTLK